MSGKKQIGHGKSGRPRDPASRRAFRENLSRQLGFDVSPQMFRWWEKKNYPFHDLNAIRWKLLNQERMPAGCDADRLRADMAAEPDKPFGRKLREVLEDMPLSLIDEIHSATDRRGKFAPLCFWVESVMRELCSHPGCPEGLPLTAAEVEDVRQYLEEQKREESAEI